MSNTRPPLAKQHTRKTEANRDAELNRGVKLTVDGEDFVVRVGDVTPAIARELRQRTGMSFLRLIDEVTVDADIDIISSLVWVARRVRGEFVDIADVNVTYQQMLGDGFDIAEAEGAEDNDSPEA